MRPRRLAWMAVAAVATVASCLITQIGDDRGSLREGSASGHAWEGPATDRAAVGRASIGGRPALLADGSGHAQPTSHVPRGQGDPPIVNSRGNPIALEHVRYPALWSESSTVVLGQGPPPPEPGPASPRDQEIELAVFLEHDIAYREFMLQEGLVPSLRTADERDDLDAKRAELAELAARLSSEQVTLSELEAAKQRLGARLPRIPATIVAE